MPETTIAELDLQGVYLVVGALIVMNIGAIGGALWFVIKLVWNAAKYDSRIEKMEKDINAAHQALRKIRDDVS